ncbi:MAG TPA: polysaccharide deacetylase family protein [Humisphaera sp.]
MLLLAVNFHYVSDDSYPLGGIYPVTPRQFEAQLDALAADFDFVGLTDLDAAVRLGRPLPERACLVTFDDGLRQQFDLAWPILLRKGVPAGFFVNTVPFAEDRVCGVHQLHWLRAHVPQDELLASLRFNAALLGIDLNAAAPHPALLARQYRYDAPDAARLKYLLNFGLARADRELLVDRCFHQHHPDAAGEVDRLYMPPEQWQELSDAGCLGTHAHDHLPLAQLAPSEAERQVTRSLDILESVTGRRPTTISYPYGGPDAVSEPLADLCASLGLTAGLTMERAFSRSADGPLMLARCNTNDAPGGSRPAFRMVGGTPVVTAADFADHRPRWDGTAAAAAVA